MVVHGVVELRTNTHDYTQRQPSIREKREKCEGLTKHKQLAVSLDTVFLCSDMCSLRSPTPRQPQAEKGGTASAESLGARSSFAYATFVLE